MDDGLGAFLATVLIAGIILGLIIGLDIRAENRRDCALAGYTAVVKRHGERLCIGVQNGEWAIEPLETIRVME